MGIGRIDNAAGRLLDFAMSKADITLPEGRSASCDRHWATRFDGTDSRKPVRYIQARHILIVP
jgi:hypothetical protein